MGLASNKWKREIIKECQLAIQEYIRWDWKRFCLFIFDISIFLSIIAIFIFENVKKQQSENITKTLKYFILAGSFYILIKFTITNFFYTETYYKKIVLYDKKIMVNGVKLNVKRVINYASISFLVIFVVMNIIVTVILNDEAATLFESQKLVTALITTLSSLLLIPAFVSSLSTIFTVKKKFKNVYKLLIRNQFFANIDLFDDYIPVNNFECVKLTKLNVKSKRGTFFLANYEDKEVMAKIKVYNDQIWKIYHDLWGHYCHFLLLVNETKIHRVTKITSYQLQNVFDTIFIDFFDFK